MSTIVLVNPQSGSTRYRERRFLVTLGAYGDTLLIVWARCDQDALDEAIDWCVDNEPGLLCDEAVADEYREAIAEGLDEDDARERAEVDTICGGNCGNYLRAWEVGISDLGRDDMLELKKHHTFEVTR